MTTSNARRALIIAIASTTLFTISGCATKSSSTPVVSGATPWEGKVLVSATEAPSGLQYKVMGSVQADAKAGYDKVETLYPLLANEARKIGANAVVSAKGGRKVSAFSWSAPYVGGIAIRVDDPESLKKINGSYY